MNINKEFIVVSILSGILGALFVAVGSIYILRAHPALLVRMFGNSEATVRASTTPESAVKNIFSEKAYTEEALVVSAVKRAKPAVVTIAVSKNVPIIERYFEQGPRTGDPFLDELFRIPIPQYRQNGTREQEVGGGSGFLVSADGLIVTNKHVVADREAEYTVFLNDGTRYAAKVVARDPVNDLAIMRIQARGLPYLEFADSDAVEVGQTAIAIGNALGEFRNTVSVGVVSGLARSVVAGNGFGVSEQLENVIQTDAAINPGNSGGPLLNLDGKVIGINVAVAITSQNIGFSVPSNLARTVVASVQKVGKIVRPYLGIRYTPITPELKEENKLSVNYGILVLRGNSKSEVAVIPGSPADIAGIEENDIILEADGKKLTEEQSLSTIIRNHKVGDTLTLKILRKGFQKTVKVRLQEMPE